MLLAHTDESGDAASTEFFAIAAFVARKTDWEAFDQDWNAVLEAHDVPHLHMRELSFFRGPYDGWTEPKRRSFLSGWMEAINRRRLSAVGAALSMASFNGLDASGREKFLDPFFCCFQEVMRGVAIKALAEKIAAQLPDCKTDVVFDQRETFSGRAKELRDVMADVIDVREGMGSFEFRDMRGTPGLQAADLLAYELRLDSQRQHERPTAPQRWPYKAIMTAPHASSHLLKFLPYWYLEAQASGMTDEA